MKTCNNKKSTSFFFKNDIPTHEKKNSIYEIPDYQKIFKKTGSMDFDNLNSCNSNRGSDNIFSQLQNLEKEEEQVKFWEKQIQKNKLEIIEKKKIIKGTLKYIFFVFYNLI